MRVRKVVGAAPPINLDSMNVFKRFESEFDDDDEDDEAELDELDPVELGAVPPPTPLLAPVLIDGDDFKFLDDEVDAAIAARINGALMTVSTLDARK